MGLIRDSLAFGVGLASLGIRALTGDDSTPQRTSGKAYTGRRSYDAGSAGARVDGWTSATNASANAETSLSLDTIRNRSRDLVRNNAWASRAIDALTVGIVAEGLRPLPNTGDKELNKRIKDLWEDWGRNCYTSSDLGIYGLQALICRAWLESGDVLIRRRRRFVADMGEGVTPIQLQVMEGDFLPTWKNQVGFPVKALPGNRIIQSVEIDALDRKVAFHVLPTHPGDMWAISGGWGAYAPVRVPASEIAHLLNETRPGQVRGIPALAPVTMALWDLGGLADAERVRAKAAACMTAWIKGMSEDEGDPPRPDGITDCETVDGELATDSGGNPVEALSPGTISYLPDGKDIVINTPTMAVNYESNVRMFLYEVAAGIGLAYMTLTGDMSQGSFISNRQAKIDERRKLRCLREQVFIPLAMDPIYKWFIEASVLAGLLPDSPLVYKHKWSSPREESASRLEDAQADKLEIRNGTRSLDEVRAARGTDSEDLDEEIAAGNERRDAKGITTDVDPRAMTAGGQFQTAPNPVRPKPKAVEPTK